MSQSPAQRLTQSIRDARDTRPALVSFLTAGYPSREHFRADVTEVAAHSDVVEIGVPFTDPMADGVTIQRSSMGALAHGVTLHWIIDELAAMPPVKAPLVLMSYMNPLLAYGLDKLAADAARVGVCGFIVPDMPLEEAGNFEAALRANGVALVRMVTPVTPPARLKHLCDGAEGFIYAVTMTGTTGKNMGAATGDALDPEVSTYLDALRAMSPVPVCAGFGIRGPAQVRLLDAHTDGVIIGSALVETLERGESVAGLLDSLRSTAA
jgi:tryptophan synthase alpha chain